MKNELRPGRCFFQLSEKAPERLRKRFHNEGEGVVIMPLFLATQHEGHGNGKIIEKYGDMVKVIKEVDTKKPKIKTEKYKTIKQTIKK